MWPHLFWSLDSPSDCSPLDSNSSDSSDCHTATRAAPKTASDPDQHCKTVAVVAAAVAVVDSVVEHVVAACVGLSVSSRQTVDAFVEAFRWRNTATTDSNWTDLHNWVAVC